MIVCLYVLLQGWSDIFFRVGLLIFASIRIVDTVTLFGFLAASFLLREVKAAGAVFRTDAMPPSATT